MISMLSETNRDGREGGATHELMNGGARPRRVRRPLVHVTDSPLPDLCAARLQHPSIQ